MAPRTRTHAGSKRAARDSIESTPVLKRQSVTCGDCGQECAAGAGLAAHRRAKHPPPPEVMPAASLTVVERNPPPDGLSSSSSQLWREIVKEYTLTAAELRLLEDACREAMLIDRLDRELAEAPLMVRGSQGQKVASPLVTEIRQHRATFATLVTKLRLPDDEESGDSAARRTVKARAAANARWRSGGA